MSILTNISAGEREYENDIKKMSNVELFEHVYDGDYHPDDFASKELKTRGYGMKGYMNDKGVKYLRLKTPNTVFEGMHFKFIIEDKGYCAVEWQSKKFLFRTEQLEIVIN